MASTASKIKHLYKKMILQGFYKKYVANNVAIQNDVSRTFQVRGCKAKKDTVETQFYHLMQYYPAYAFTFFWRIKRRDHKKAHLFTKDYHCKIFGSTKIEGGLTCYHPYATVINARKIGKNFQFRNSLTIGNKNNDNSLLPTIGDDVTVGANVVIIGDITIGDHVIVGAGSVVVKDVPSNSIVAGNPAKVIKSNPA